MTAASTTTNDGWSERWSAGPFPPDPRPGTYGVGVLARLLDRTAARRVGDLRAALGEPAAQDDPERQSALLADLLSVEDYRRTLRSYWAGSDGPLALAAADRPDQVKAALDPRPGERVLAACRSGETDHLVATDRALYAVTGARTTRWRWDLIDQARWQPPIWWWTFVRTPRAPSSGARWRPIRRGPPGGGAGSGHQQHRGQQCGRGPRWHSASRRPPQQRRRALRMAHRSRWVRVAGRPAVAQAVDAELRSLRAQFEA